MPAPVLYIGQGPPDAVVITMAASDDFDPTTVTGAVFNYTKPTGVQGSWSAAITTQNANEIVLTYVLSTPDLDTRGFWKIYAVATVPGGTKRSVTGQFQVKNPDEL